MTTPQTQSNEAVASQAFIKESRRLLVEEYLPKIERCLENLSDEQIWWRPNPESNSVGNLLLHTSGNARQWIVCGLGGKPDERQRQSEFDAREGISRAELLGKLRTTVADVDRVLEGFEPERLLDDYSIQGTKATALAAILHVTEHFSMHTGQIILMTKMFTETDLAFYDFSGGAPALPVGKPQSAGD